MDQKRFLSFIILSMGILIGWNAFVMPRFKPPNKPKAAQNQPAKAAENAEARDAAGRQRDLADRGPAVGVGKPEGDAAGDEKSAEANPTEAQAPRGAHT